MGGIVEVDWIEELSEMVFSEINSAWTFWKNFKEWRHSRKQPTETIAARFVRLFETHGVHRNQIPRFFGHGLTLKDVQDDVSLLAKLDEPLLDAACEKFAVRREWLDGAEKRAYPQHDFYKRPEDFEAFLRELLVGKVETEVSGVLAASEEYSDDSAVIILQEPIGEIGDKVIYRYHLCDGWTFCYWKARAYLTACVAIAWRKRVFIHGKFLPQKVLDKLSGGETLLGWWGEGIWELGGKRWYAEDMALLPEVYIRGIDPEQGDFGITAGLRMWLDLDEMGFMKTGMDHDPRLLFKNKLAQYES